MSDQIDDHSGSPNDIISMQDIKGRAQYESSGSQIRPWVRYWARMTDLFIFNMVIGLITLICASLFKLSDVIYGLLAFVLYNFAEAALLATWGTTPGKAFFKVRVRNSDGSKLSYIDGLSRAFKIMFYGEGLGIIPICIFTLIKAHNRLTNKGITSWDEDKGIVVSHQMLGPWRVIGILVLFAVFLGLMVLGILGSADGTS